MPPVSQAQTFGDIRLDGQGNTLTINQVVQISVAEVKTRTLVAASPYVGLRRFEERNKDIFFGRDRLVAQLLEMVTQHNLVLVAGASGSGKSSLVRAGLLPQLAARLPQGRFRALIMTPDRDPFSSLKAALQGADVAQSKLQALDSRTRESLVEVLTTQRTSDELWLLFVDQLEEIFTLCADPLWCQAFLSGLTLLAQRAQREIKIVVAMRADFFDRFGPHPQFGALAQQSLQLVLDMEASELRAAIEQPAAKHGVVFEDGLVDQIIADIKGRPGALPILQYTLDLLWRADQPGDDRTLNTTSYHQIGGIEGALRLRADTLYRYSDAPRQLARLPAQQELMRQIFLRLVDLTSQGAEARAVSRRAARTDFGRSEEVQLIRELVDEKLLVTNAALGASPHPGGTATVEIAHEALLSAWPLLKSWIEQAREVIYVRNRLATDARRFVEIKARAPALSDDELWSGTRLSQALDMQAHGDFLTVLGGLSADEKLFLDTSLQVRDKRANDEKARQQQVVRSRRLLVALGSVLSLVSILGLLFGLTKERQRLRQATADKDEIQKNATRAEKRARAALGARAGSLSQQPGSAAEALALGIQAVGESLVHGEPPEEDAAEGLATALSAVAYPQIIGEGGSLKHAAFSPDGSLIVTVGSIDDKSQTVAHLWNARTGKLLCPLSSEWGFNGTSAAVFSPGSDRVVTVDGRGQAYIWEVRGCRKVTTFDAHADEVNSGAFSPDGLRVLTASSDGTAQLWDAKTGAALAVIHNDAEGETPLPNRRLHHGRPEPPTPARYGLRSAQLSPDGKTVLTLGWVSAAAKLWQVSTGRRLGYLGGHAGNVAVAVFSPDGLHVATGGEDGTVRFFDTRTGNHIRTLSGHKKEIKDLAFSPDGQWLATASEDGTAQIWERATGKSTAVLLGHTADVTSVSFSPNGELLLTTSKDGTARLYSAKDGSLKGPLVGSSGSLFSSGISGGVFSPSGDRIATYANDGGVYVWTLGSQRTLRVMEASRAVKSVTVTQDGTRLVVIAYGGEVTLWDLASGQKLAVLQAAGVHNQVWLAGHDPLVVSGQSGTAIFDPHTGRRLRTLYTGDDWWAKLLQVSPDGKRIIMVSRDYAIVRQWDSDSGAAKPEIKLKAYGPVALSPDAELLAVADDEGVRLLHLAGGGPPGRLAGHLGDAKDIEFSPDGSRLLETSSTHPSILWDLASGRILSHGTLPGHPSIYSAFSADGKRVAVWSDNGVSLMDPREGHSIAMQWGQLGNVNFVQFAPMGGRILTKSNYTTTRLWEADGRAIATLRGHSGQIKSATLSPDGLRVATAEYEGKAQLFSAVTGHRLAIFFGHQRDVDGALFTPDGRYVVTYGIDGTVRVYAADPKDLVAMACAILNGNPLLTTVERFCKR